MRIQVASSEKPLGVKTEDGQLWDQVVFHEVTCDGTMGFLYEAIGGVREVANRIATEHPGCELGEMIEKEKFHKADMAYGKNVDVVTWTVAIPIRLNARPATSSDSEPPQ